MLVDDDMVEQKGAWLCKSLGAGGIKVDKFVCWMSAKDDAWVWRLLRRGRSERLCNIC